MLNLYSLDVECLDNYYGVSIVSVNGYLDMFKDIVDDDGNPIPLVQKLTVAEIKQRLANVQKRCFYIMEGHDDTVPLAAWLNGMRPRKDANHIYTYNGLKYDNYMVAFFLMFWENYKDIKQFLHDAYLFNRKLIDKRDDWDALKKDFQYRACAGFALPYVDLDVMAIFALNKVGVRTDPKTGNKVATPKGLKQTSINLQWYELLEYSMPPIGEEDYKLYWQYPEYKGLSADELNSKVNTWDRLILPQYVDDMKHYNFNDCFIVCEIIRLYGEEIKSRYAISRSYNVNALNASRSKIGDIMFSKYYSEFSGLAPHQWQGQKTMRKKLELKKVIFPNVTFETKPLQDLLTDMHNVVLTRMSKEEFERNVTIGDVTYTIGTGGLHSQDKPMEVWSKDGYTLIEQDCASMYPTIMSEYGIAPAHMSKNAFVKLVTWMKDTRIAIKHSDAEYTDGIKSSVLALILKITINSLYGKLNAEMNGLYDPLAALKVTINGQLMMLMLCERLYLNNIRVLSANTDGIMVFVHDNQMDLFNDIVRNWEQDTKFKTDGDKFQCFISRDINNYIGLIVGKKGLKFHLKGAFDPQMYSKDLSKGYNMPIVPKAVVEYFINKTPIMETLRNATNILDFCTTQNVGRNWHVEMESIKNGSVCIERCQRYVRFYISNRGVVLKKCNNLDKRRGNLAAGQVVTVLNSLDDKDISLRDINYKYYYERCMDMVNPIRLGISPKGRGKTKIKKYYNDFNTLFDV